MGNIDASEELQTIRELCDRYDDEDLDRLCLETVPALVAENERLRGWLTQIERQAPVHSPANIAAAAALYTSRKAAAQDA